MQEVSFQTDGVAHQKECFGSEIYMWNEHSAYSTHYNLLLFFRVPRNSIVINTVKGHKVLIWDWALQCHCMSPHWNKFDDWL